MTVSFHLAGNFSTEPWLWGKEFRKVWLDSIRWGFFLLQFIQRIWPETTQVAKKLDVSSQFRAQKWREKKDGKTPNQIFPQKLSDEHLGVSKNRDTPKSSHSNRVFPYKAAILGYPNFWKHPFQIYCSLQIAVVLHFHCRYPPTSTIERISSAPKTCPHQPCGKSLSWMRILNPPRQLSQCPSVAPQPTGRHGGIFLVPPIFHVGSKKTLQRRETSSRSPRVFKTRGAISRELHEVVKANLVVVQKWTDVKNAWKKMNEDRMLRSGIN